jgi:hypothetical protein
MKKTISTRVSLCCKRLLTALVLSVCLLAPLGQSVRSEPGKPWGSYSNRVSDGGLQNPFIKGFMLTVSWRQIQPSNGTAFDWSKVDEELKKATMAGRDVTFILHAGGQHTPDWVKDTKGVQLISIIDASSVYHKKTYCERVTIPVFWDPIFLEKKKNFIAEAGRRYGTNSNVSGVMVPFANFITSDWHVPHDADDSGRKCGFKFHQIRDWKNAGYTTEKMFNAGKETIDAWAAVFPGKALKLPVHPTHKDLEDDKDGTAATASKLAEKIIKYGYEKYPNRFYPQVNTLNAKTLYANDPRIAKADPNTNNYILKLLTNYPNHIGLQMLAAASNGNKDNCRQNRNDKPCDPYKVLLDSVKAGLSYKPHYIEYWHEDAENRALRDVLKDANIRMEQ